MNYDQNVYQPTKVTPLERTLNLVIALLNTPSYMTAEHIRRSVAGYGNEGEAFRQMFERDKKLLLTLGVPIRTGVSEDNYPVEGYRILPDEYALPVISFTSEERSVIALALQLFHEDGHTPARSGLDKIAHTSPLDAMSFGQQIYSDSSSRHPLEMANLKSLATTASQGKAVTFYYRTRETLDASQRNIEPWGVIADNGYWYCLGFDQARKATRVFRVSRITTAVEILASHATAPRPHGNIRDMFHDHLSDIGRYIAAKVEVQPGRAPVLYAEATSCHPTPAGTEVLDFVAVRYDWLKEEVLAAGEDAWVLGPADLREDMKATLAAIAGRGVTDEG